MARTLAQIDAALAQVEAAIPGFQTALNTLQTRVDNLRDAGLVLRTDVDQVQADITALYLNLEAAKIAAAGAVEALRDDATTMLRKVKKAVQRERSASLPQDDSGKPHANPLIERVMVRGKVVARSRMAR